MNLLVRISSSAARQGRLAVKVAVITGAASGIGRGLAERSAQEGMRVVLADVELVARAASSQQLLAAQVAPER